MWKRSHLRFLLAVLTLLGVYYFLSLTFPEDESQTTGKGSKEPVAEHSQRFPISSLKNNTLPKAPEKAAFVVLARNSDVHQLRESMRELEDRFNHKYNYPYIFLNNEHFDEQFKRLTTAMTKGKTEYGLIPEEHWSIPDWIDYSKAKRIWKKMEEAEIIYGGSESYRHMCRFESGFFYRHPLLENFDYYWRLEPGVHFYCDLDFDPFEFMRKNKKKYGFTLSLHEYEQTIPTLWQTTKDFIKKYPQYVAPDSAMQFVTEDGGKTYNGCHFWSNFEIGDLNFWRSDAYMKYFEYLDQHGGFFYERWGDAPVHSIAAALFLNKDEIHFFNEIAYRHDLFMHCPVDKELQLKCHCDPNENFDLEGFSCTARWLEMTEK